MVICDIRWLKMNYTKPVIYFVSAVVLTLGGFQTGYLLNKKPEVIKSKKATCIYNRQVAYSVKGSMQGAGNVETLTMSGQCDDEAFDEVRERMTQPNTIDGKITKEIPKQSF